MIPPLAQRAMSKRAGSTVVEVAASHAIYISQPAPVIALIEQAASSGSGAITGAIPRSRHMATITTKGGAKIFYKDSHSRRMFFRHPSVR